MPADIREPGLSFELKTVLPVGKSDAGGDRLLTRTDGRRVTDDLHEVTFAARLHLQHAETVVDLVTGYSLDCASERFLL